jgi:regulator of protease activity HflC (stomatin/prohibitin superfamily)
MESFTFILVLAVIFIVSIISKGVRVVQQSECMIVERLGSYSRTLKNGLNIIIPIIDSPRTSFWILNGRIIPTNRLDLRETVLDIPEQNAITRDNVSISIDALLYIQIIDPVKVSYEIANLPMAIAQLAQTSLRSVIGELDLDNTLASRDIINTKLKAVLEEAADKWGATVNRVEIKNITPPREIQVAMEKQMQAERERRAKILEAEGLKQAMIANSEGSKQELINNAEGNKEAAVRQAEGEAIAIRQVAEAKKEALMSIKEALGDSTLVAQYLIASNYLETLAKFQSKPGDKIFMPYESSQALGALGSIKELMDKGNPRENRG